MTAYESLNRVRNSKAEYERLLVKVEYLEALAEKATPIISGMPRASAKAGQSDDPWAALVDYKESCREQLTAYIRDCEAYGACASTGYHGTAGQRKCGSRKYGNVFGYGEGHRDIEVSVASVDE